MPSPARSRSRSRSPARRRSPSPTRVKRARGDDTEKAPVEQTATVVSKVEEVKIDREKVRRWYRSIVNFFKVCPLLLRVFTSFGGHHRLESYADRQLPDGELQIYTWYYSLHRIFVLLLRMDASLKELAGLIRDVNAEVIYHCIRRRKLFLFAT